MPMNQVTLNMVVSDALQAMEFYHNVFAGIKGEVYQFSEREQANEANVAVGNLCLRLIDENSQYDCFPPQKDAIDSIWLQIEVKHTDVILQTAIENGATVRREPTEFMGIRSAEILDPFGYVWTIQQVVEKISFEDRYRLYEQMFAEEDKQ